MSGIIRKVYRNKPAVIAGLLASTMLAGGLAWSAADAATTPAAAPLSLPAVENQAGFAELAAKVKPAVVNIATTERSQVQSLQQIPELPQDSPLSQMFRQFFGQNGQYQFFEQQKSAPTHALGSGFIVDPAGYIVTNNHVIDGSQKIMVTLDDGSSYAAKIIGRDDKTDLALLKIDAGKPLPYVAFGNSDKERVGDWVIAVGNPFGLGGTVTAGIVSAHGRDINSGPYDDFLQIDAPINPGNSGGPLFNQSGQVIGIDSAIYSPNGGSVGIGFAIPSNLASNVVAQLRERGMVERGWLGIEMQPMTAALSKAVGLQKDEGVLVDQITPNSPAAKADLRQGDVITAYDGEAIHTPRDFAMAVANTQAGKTMQLSLWRGGHEMTVDVSVGVQQPEKTAAAPTKTGEAPVGMALARLTPDARQQFGINPSVKGVVVAEVAPDSRAAESGVQAGDVIERVGSHSVFTPKEAVAEIHAAEQAHKDAVPVLISRDGSPYYLALQLANG